MPLYYGLEERLPGVTTVVDLPSRLAARMAIGELDIALIPSVEFLRGVASRGYFALPGAAIASQSAVRSVKLLSTVPIDRIRRLALDEGSRTSQALCRIWLDGVHGIRPELLEELPIGVPPEESTADAVLVIGDRAMRIDESRFHAVVDMGEAWNRWTGLPFVFAVWAAAPHADVKWNEVTTALNACRDEGLKNADRIAAEHASRLGLTFDECLSYLTKNLTYFLGEPELAGLRLYAAKAEAMGLVPERCDVVLHRSRDLACRG
jgi:chorismate dehydratase